MSNSVPSASLIAECASRLWQARSQAQPSGLPSRSMSGFDLASGYAVGHCLHRRLVSDGYRAVGRKLGFTNPATWKEFDLDTPIWAHVYDRTVHWAHEGAACLSIAAMTAPRIEPEIVLHLSQDVGADAPDAQALAACIDWAAIGFEIVDCHYRRWQFTAPDAVADFGVHAALVVGPRLALDERDATAALAGLSGVQVSLQRNNETVATGCGANALGNPVRAVAHIAGVLARQPWAPPLAAGEIVSTGTLTPFPEIAAGEVWSVTVSGGETLTLALD